MPSLRQEHNAVLGASCADVKRRETETSARANSTLMLRARTLPLLLSLALAEKRPPIADGMCCLNRCDTCGYGSVKDKSCPFRDGNRRRCAKPREPSGDVDAASITSPVPSSAAGFASSPPPPQPLGNFDDILNVRRSLSSSPDRTSSAEATTQQVIPEETPETP